MAIYMLLYSRFTGVPNATIKSDAFVTKSWLMIAVKSANERSRSLLCSESRLVVGGLLAAATKNQQDRFIPYAEKPIYIDIDGK